MRDVGSEIPNFRLRSDKALVQFEVSGADGSLVQKTLPSAPGYTPFVPLAYARDA